MQHASTAAVDTLLCGSSTPYNLYFIELVSTAAVGTLLFDAELALSAHSEQGAFNHVFGRMPI